jgi:SAM-dependent methyltransferase
MDGPLAAGMGGAAHSRTCPPPLRSRGVHHQTERDYWDEVGRLDDGLPPGWRRHARAQHLALVEAWVGEPTGSWLKTDLYEERSPHRSMLEHLPSATWLGCDLSPEVLARAAARTPLSGVACDVRALPFANRSLDGVLSTSTLDHFARADDLGSALAELHRVLRPGGRLVLTLDNPRNPLIRLRNALPATLARATGLSPFTVGHTLGEAGGRAALTAAGFRVEHSAHLLHAPHVIGTRLARFGWYERRVLPRTDALGRTRLGTVSGHYVAFCARAG